MKLFKSSSLAIFSLQVALTVGCATSSSEADLEEMSDFSESSSDETWLLDEEPDFTQDDLTLNQNLDALSGTASVDAVDKPTPPEDEAFDIVMSHEDKARLNEYKNNQLEETIRSEAYALAVCQETQAGDPDAGSKVPEEGSQPKVFETLKAYKKALNLDVAMEALESCPSVYKARLESGMDFRSVLVHEADLFALRKIQCQNAIASK